MNRFGALLYGVIAYVGFLGAYLYLIGFLGNFVVPKTVDSGSSTPVGQALAIDLALLGLLGIQHSVMARPLFKKWWTRYVPMPIERSTYVLLSNLLFAFLFWQWRPLPDVVWEVGHSAGVAVLWGAFWLGWLIVLVSSFLIDHFDLFGLKQVYYHWRGRELPTVAFHVRAFYKIVRHPLLLGWLIAFWATPQMTVGHLVFAVGMTVYVLIAIHFEERNLLEAHGQSYADYRKRVSMILPIPRRASNSR